MIAFRIFLHQALYFMSILISLDSLRKKFHNGVIQSQSQILRLYTRNYCSPRQLLLQFDGGSRGNPGLGGSGAVLYLKEPAGQMSEVWSGSFFLGKSGVTNNVAEYHGLIEGLRQGVKMKVSSLLIEGDSQLVIRQIEGAYKVRSKNLISLHQTAMELLQKIPSTILRHIPRNINRRADELSNIAMDLMISKTCNDDIEPSIILSGSKSHIPTSKSRGDKSGQSSSVSIESNHHKLVIIPIFRDLSKQIPTSVIFSERPLNAKDKEKHAIEASKDALATSSTAPPSADTSIEFLSHEIHLPPYINSNLHSAEPSTPTSSSLVADDLLQSYHNSNGHDTLIDSIVLDFLAQNKLKGKIVDKYTLWFSTTNNPAISSEQLPPSSTETAKNSIVSGNTVMPSLPNIDTINEGPLIKHSSINYCVVELESVSKALKKIEKLNSKLTTRLAKSSALANKRRRKPVRAPANNILNMGVVRLVSVPIKSMATYLAEESHVHNRVVDQFLFSWALGYRCATS